MLVCVYVCVPFDGQEFEAAIVVHAHIHTKRKKELLHINLLNNTLDIIAEKKGLFVDVVVVAAIY